MSVSIDSALLEKVRKKFAQIDQCPIQGERVFFENAGGALCLNSVVETSAHYAAIPDNQGRANVGSQELNRVISQAKADMHAFMNAHSGQFIVGESGTELLFRLITNACLGVAEGGVVLGSTLEHPATRSACARWSKVAGLKHVLVNHDDASGTINAEAYAAAVTADTRVATIIHTSPVTGMGVQLAEIAAAIRSASPECFIIVDGIQHAAHGMIDIDSYQIDGYVVSPYKMFSRHGYGLAWISDRLTAVPHDGLQGGPTGNWELGTRDTGSYAAFSDVVAYFSWLGEELDPEADQRTRFVNAGKAIKAQEKVLTDAMINGTGNVPGLAKIKNVHIVGGNSNPAREGLVGFWIDNTESADIVDHLNEQGIRTHVRKADYYSSNILEPLGREHCVRVSMCHYNTVEEVARFLHAMQHFA